MPASYVIRQATVDDSDAMLKYLHDLLGEPDIHLISEQDELTITPEGERRLVTEMLASENSTMLLALDETGRIIGEISCRGESRRAKRHVGVIGISVVEAWRDRGLGSAMMSAIIAWARATGVITRLELLVFVENHRAVHVYEKMGFVVEGTKRRAIYKWDAYHDEYLMSLLLNESSA